MKNEQKYHTDTNYLSRKNLKYDDRYFDSNNDDLWEDVLDYRKKYTFQIPLFFKDYKNVSLTQTPWILQKEIKMISEFSTIQQKMLSDISTMYSSTILEDIEMKSIIEDVHWLLEKNNNFNISRTIVESIINHSLEPSDEFEKKILKMYDNIIFLTKKIVSPREIAKKFFSQSFSNSKELSDIHVSLMDTIKSDKINSLLTKAAAIVFAILSNNMFGENSYQIMILSLFSLLRNSYKGVILKGISFFNVFEYFKSELEVTVDQAKEDSGDLTYVTMLMIKIILYSVHLSSEKIETFTKKEIRYNFLSTKEKNKSIKNILSEHPELSVKQVKFFVSHSNSRFKYTIKDFQKYFGTSYETARYSLDGLVDSGFYNKRKVGKKYIYGTFK